MLEQRIRDRSDVYGVRAAIRTLARDVGFGSRAGDELAIVVSELASNILKYGVHGHMCMAQLAAPDSGLRIVARDFGPPFHDVALALRDGYDDRGPIDPALVLQRGGFGGGLGAVVRLSHAFRVEPLADGKAIEVVRYRDRALAVVRERA